MRCFAGNLLVCRSDDEVCKQATLSYQVVPCISVYPLVGQVQGVVVNKNEK